MRFRNRRAIVVAAVSAVIASMTAWGASPGWAGVTGPDLTVGARHEPSHVVPSMVAANLYLTVRNAGRPHLELRGRRGCRLACT